jgi:hypothetical protein
MRFQPDRLLTENTPARFDEPAPVDRRETPSSSSTSRGLAAAYLAGRGPSVD